MTSLELIEKYISFFEKRKHKRISNSPLIPENDPTTLFTSSGMQSLVPYLLGEPHPQGKRLVNVQNCFRAGDIDEVGDNRHTTFFRMLGNWSLGGYFKEEQLPWFFEFLTQELKINPQKLYVSVFSGFNNIPRDEESYNIWKRIFESVGINPQERIVYYGSEMNWWSRAGVPEDMPEGEPGGPDSEVFYQFDIEHNPQYGKTCHFNCQCGRFLEIGNSVFMEYQKQSNDSFKSLPQKNVDFGGGLERLLAAVENKPDIFQTSLFKPVINTIEQILESDYKINSRAIRIITDHLVASVFMAVNGIIPSNKEQGYILRRLLRRAIRYGRVLGNRKIFTADIASAIIDNYSNTDPDLLDKKEVIKNIFTEEEEKFVQVIHKGLKKAEAILASRIPIESNKYSKLMQISGKKELFRSIYRNKNLTEKSDFLQQFGVTIAKKEIEQATITGEEAFDIYQSFGFPVEMIVELAQGKNLLVDIEEFERELEKHQQISRKGAEKKFAGGLADHREKTIRGHTATHLLHQALRDVLGNNVHQTGSNITAERIRFDFSHEEKLTPEQIKKVEEIVNQKIRENLPVHFKLMDIAEAKKIGAIGLFDKKYQDKVKVYFIGDYSKEFCGGPHISFTGELKSFKIKKEEALGKGRRRIYATLAEPS